MIAVDTNLLVYAHRPESPFHDRALRVLEGLWVGSAPWGTPVHCLIEFAAVVSNPRIWRAASHWDEVADQIAVWQESSSCRFLGDDGVVWSHTLEFARRGMIQGAGWYEARIAGVCLAHGVRELWSADRDYSRFPTLRVRNPLIGEGTLPRL